MKLKDDEVWVCGNCGRLECNCTYEDHFTITKGEYDKMKEKEKRVAEMAEEVKDIEVSSSYVTAQKLIKARQLKGGRMGINDDLCNTNLISKDYSPMFIRKYNASALHNWPLYISMICDEDVSDIDQVVNGVLKAYDDSGLIGNNLQNMRNLTGIISETLSKHYNNKKENCVEAIAVTLYIDKNYIQSFTGDYMSHFSCRMEYTQALMMMTQI